MASTVFVRLLGAFSIDIDGHVVTAEDFERRSGLELVQLLALSPSGIMHRDQILDALWPDVDPAVAVNRFHQAASYARKALGSSKAITTKGSAIELFPNEELSVDCRIIERADLHDPEALQTAADLCGSELLPANLYDEWTIRPRDRLRLLQLSVLHKAERWEEALQLDGADEVAHIALMQLALDDGNHEGVLRRYDLLTETLHQQGIEVGGQARALFEAATQRAAAGEVVTGIRAFLATDSGRPPEGGPEANAAIDSEAATQIDALIRSCGGVAFAGPEDNRWAAFLSITDAIQAAIRCLELDGAVSRAALDLGEATSQAGVWSGSTIDRCDRILKACESQQILCSSTLTDLARPGLPSSLRLREVGLTELRDGQDTELARLSQLLDAGDGTAPVRPRNRLGGAALIESRPLVGRAAELEDIASALAAYRLVTVTGPGGVGKTHLARSAARCVANHYADGVWFCQFGKISDRPGAEHELLAAIGGQHHGDASVVESIVRSLTGRRCLILFDNCEHLVEPIATLSRIVQDHCPDVTLLATSRTPIGVNGEKICAIGALQRRDAIELFIAEAERRSAAVASDDPALDRICEQLDDLPLALQLAAARTVSLDLPSIETLLTDRFSHLESTDPAALEHQRTLKASISWSFENLDARLQQVLSDLSVLANDFDLESAVAICSRGLMTDAELTRAVAELVERSLVAGPHREGGRTTYRLLESVRLFAREKATDDHAQQRHLDFFVARLKEANELLGHRASETISRIRADWDDIRLAQAYAKALGDLSRLTQLLGSLTPFANMTQGLELLEWCQSSLEPNPNEVISLDHARALAGWAALLAQRGQIEDSEPIAQVAGAAFPDDGSVQWGLAYGPWSEGDLVRTRQHLEIIIANGNADPDMSYPGALLWLSMLGAAEGEDVSDHAHQLEVLAANGDPVYRVMALLARSIQVGLDDPAKALALVDECILTGDTYDAQLISITARTTRAMQLAFLGETHLAAASSRDTLQWASDRGLWAWSLATLPAAAYTLTRVERSDTAVTLLAARSATEYAKGYGADLANTMAAQLLEEHPDRYQSWWEAGLLLDLPSALNLAITTLDGILAEADG